MADKCECKCDVCKKCLNKTHIIKRFIKWAEESLDHWTGFDQWNERWNIDGRTLKHGVLLTKKNGADTEIIEYFDDIDTAKEVAELINSKRGHWSDK